MLKKIGLFLLSLLISFSLYAADQALSEVKNETLLAKLKLEVQGNIDFYTKYIWRGFTMENDPVIQPGFALSCYGFSAKFWSNWDADNNDNLSSNEMDYIFDYTKQFSIYKVFLGHIYYDFVGVNKFSREGYIGFGLTEIPYFKLPISISITYFKDYGKESSGGGRGTYLALDTAYSPVIYKKLGITLDLATRYAYNRRLFIQGRDGRDLYLKLGFTIPFTSNLTVSPSVNYCMPFKDLNDENDGNQKRKFYAGVSVAYKF